MKLWMDYGIWLRAAIVPLVVMTMLFCNGCWDKKELNQLALAQVIAIDYKEAQYQLTLQLIIPGADKETVTSDNLWNMTGSGNSVGEAMQQISRAAPREIYLDHLDLVLLGEGVLSHGVDEALSYLMKENVLRRRTRLLAVKDSAGTLLADSTALAKMDIFYIDNLLKDQERYVQGDGAIINTYYLTGNGLQETLVIPRIVLEPEAELRLDGAALVQQDVLACWVDKTWLSGYYWTTGGSEIMTLPGKEEQIVVELQKKKCKWEIDSEEPLAVKTTLRATIRIVSGSEVWKDSAEAEAQIRQIQADVEENALQQISETVRHAQKMGTDAFRLGSHLYARHPDLIQKDNWPAQFAALPIALDIYTSVELQ